MPTLRWKLKESYYDYCINYLSNAFILNCEETVACNDVI